VQAVGPSGVDSNSPSRRRWDSRFTRPDSTGSKLFDENLLLIKQIGLDNSGAINQAG
jgi:hypothetical protein